MPPEGPQYEDYRRVKMMLNHPFKAHVNEVFDTEGERRATYADAYAVCSQVHTHHPHDYYGDTIPAKDLDEFVDEEQVVDVNQNS